MTSTTMNQKAGKPRRREKRTAVKRPGLVTAISASAAADDAMQAKQAFDRADAWARGDQRPYGMREGK